VVGRTSSAEQPPTPPRVSDNGVFGGDRPERASSGGSSGGGSGSSGGGGKPTAATQPAGAPTAPTATTDATPAAAATAPAQGQTLSRGARRRRKAQTAAAAAAAAPAPQPPPPAVVAKPAPEPPARAPGKQWADLLRSPSKEAVAKQLPAATQPASSEAAGGPWHTMGARGRTQQQQGQQQHPGHPSASPRPTSAGRPAGPRAAAGVAKQGPGARQRRKAQQAAATGPVGPAVQQLAAVVATPAQEPPARAPVQRWADLLRLEDSSEATGGQLQQAGSAEAEAPWTVVGQRKAPKQQQKKKPHQRGADKPAGSRAAAGAGRQARGGPCVSKPAGLPSKGSPAPQEKQLVAPARCYKSALLG